MVEFSLDEILHPVLPKNPFDSTEILEYGKIASESSMEQLHELSKSSVGDNPAKNLVEMTGGSSLIRVSRLTFVDFVVEVLEKERTRSLAKGSLYAIRVRDPPWYRLKDTPSTSEFVSGTEVGSILGEAMASSTPQEVRKSIEKLASEASVVEVALGHVGSRLRILTFGFTDQ